MLNSLRNLSLTPTAMRRLLDQTRGCRAQMREGRKAESILWHMRQSDMALDKEARGCDEQFLRRLSIVGFNAGMLLSCAISDREMQLLGREWCRRGGCKPKQVPRGHQSWSCLRKRLEIIKREIDMI